LASGQARDLRDGPDSSHGRPDRGRRCRRLHHDLSGYLNGLASEINDPQQARASRHQTIMITGYMDVVDASALTTADVPVVAMAQPA
jgi:hypothetical protein